MDKVVVCRYWNVYRICCVILPTVIGVVLPSFILLMVKVTVGGMPFDDALHHIIDGQFAEGTSLFFLMLTNSIPFFVLSVLLFGISFFRLERYCRLGIMWFLCLCGLFAIMIVIIPIHVAVWAEMYGPKPPSSTGALAFVVAPVYGMISMSVALGLGWLAVHLVCLKSDKSHQKHIINYKALVALLMSILSFFNLYWLEYLFCISGIILAVIVLVKARKAESAALNRGIAFFALALGILNLIWQTYAWFCYARIVYG